MSSDGTITLEASARFTRLENELERSRRKIEQLERAGGKFGQNSRRSFDNAAAALGKVARQALVSIGVYRTLGSVISGVTAAIDEQKQLAASALSESEQIAIAQRRFFAVTARPGISGAAARATLDQIRTLARQEGIPEAAAITAGGQVLSAAGGELVRPEVIVNSLKTFAPFFRGMSEGLGEAASSTVDLQRNLGLTAEQSRNLAITTMGEARVTDVANLDKIIRGIAAGGRSLVEKFPEQRQQIARELGAMVGALSSAIVDTTGELTSTAIPNMLTAMEETLGEETMPMEGLRRIRDEGLRDQFEENLLGRAVTKKAQDSLIAGLDNLETIYKNITTQETPAIRGVLENLDRGASEIVLDNARRALKSGAAGSRLTRDMQGLVQEQLGPEGAIAQTFRTMPDILAARYFRTGQALQLATGITTPEDVLQDMQALLEQRLAAITEGPGFFPGLVDATTRQERDADRKTIENTLIEIRNLLDLISQQNESGIEGQLRGNDELRSAIETTTNASAAAAQAGNQREKQN